MPEHGDTIRLVPKDQDSYDETMAVVEEHGWEEASAGQGATAAWTVPDEDAKVRFIEDGGTAVEYFEVEGPGRAAAAKQLQAKIEMLEPSEFRAHLDQFDDDVDAQRLALFTVATAAPEKSDAKVVKLLVEYLSHEDSLIRRTAMIAMGITRWKDFIPPLEQVRDEDPDEQIRKRAENAIEALSKA
ncbi:HEAT repeat domain-containing protein [Solirubrobacter sp. CPCC 204708]|uniref:HEAT repeat domain-containing protein n=1 Tax=Solirubrobacter deserti TaxID=2282478 RepID=A0ABT4RSR0_9ACTN|nr:HEAT repeat domain-containing protein [Solirubrobacter deserti]MBE2316412.1 HEAT repeat domain-containing protein [Solirubrobacter deserti]MDA0141615.1 HEAT repeat domain-containing protein [Solirubrobacter deserti]